MATVGAITNMGSSRSIRLHKQIVLIWDWALTRNNWISASHIPGKLNVEADKESRDNITRTEWMLSFYTFNSILNQLNFVPEVDLFASRINNKLPCQDLLLLGQILRLRSLMPFQSHGQIYRFMHFLPSFALIGYCKKLGSIRPLGF